MPVRRVRLSVSLTSLSAPAKVIATCSAGPLPTPPVESCDHWAAAPLARLWLQSLSTLAVVLEAGRTCALYSSSQVTPLVARRCEASTVPWLVLTSTGPPDWPRGRVAPPSTWEAMVLVWVKVP